MKRKTLNETISPTGKKLTMVELEFESTSEMTSYLNSYEWQSLEIGYGANVLKSTFPKLVYTAWNSCD